MKITLKPSSLIFPKLRGFDYFTLDLKENRLCGANAGAVEYMQAMATVTLAEAVREGKVNTIVIPYDFKGIVNVPEGSQK